MGRVVVVGSTNMDLVVRGKTLPRPGETVTGGEFFEAFGGKGANQAVAARRAGAEVSFIGCVGDDRFGAGMRRNLVEEGIDVAGLGTAEGAASGVAVIMVDEGGENMISVAPGANGRLSPAVVEAAAARVHEADIVLVQLEIPLESVYAVVETAGKAGVPVALNPAPVPSAPLDDVCLAGVSYIIPNRRELGMLTAVDTSTGEGMEEAASRLRARGPGSVIVTLGAEGVFCLDGDEGTRVPPPGVRSVDTVGAGDCFAGCFAAAVAEGMTVHEAVMFGVAAASVCVTRRGAQPSMPVRDEIEDALRNA